MKKIMTIAEVELVRLNANDIVTASGDPNTITPEYNPQDPTLAPDRSFFGGSDLNYRGVEKGYEDEEW